ncbi:MAG: ABC transporter ATP-binding protein [Treponema sp.]|nr:ABC transporter ATP-binding protein [Treponema sp.]
MSEIVHIENLEKTYVTSGEALTVLNGLNLSVDEGNKIVITGESGCGKSTLLNIIGGIDKASSGSVTCGNWNVTQLDEDAHVDYRAHFLGFVFQFHYLLKDFTALENVYLPAYMSGTSKKEAMEHAHNLLADVGLSERANHLPSQLSGGERQRAAVARALINNPLLILADEPTGNLDPANADMVGNLLFSMVDKYNKTLILVTHDKKLATCGDTCYVIRNGKLERENLARNLPL